MTVSVTKCDICGAVKGEANKWIEAAAYDRGAAAGPGLYIGVNVANELRLDLCSDTCLQKKLAEVLAAIRSEPEQGEAQRPDGRGASSISESSVLHASAKLNHVEEVNA